jgi:hypothetical protein
MDGSATAMRTFPVHRFHQALAALSLAVVSVGSAPLGAQALPLAPVGGAAGCSTEVLLYVDKTESTNARDTARAVLTQLSADAINPAPARFAGPVSVTVFGFAGELPISTFDSVPLPFTSPQALTDLLDRTILQEPSSARTLAPDYLALFDHITETARSRPTIASRRIFIVISDFSTRRGEALHENALPSQVAQRLTSLRQQLVASGKQRLLAVRTQPRQEPSPSLQNDLLGSLANNFPLVEDPAKVPTTVDEILADDSPLELALTFNPQTSVYSLTLANPSCSERTNIEYHTRAAGNDARLALPWCPPRLRPGEAGTCTFAPTQIVLPPLADSCLEVWLRAHSTVGGTTQQVIGSANQPITVGNCVFLSRLDVDLAKRLNGNQDLAECARAAGPSESLSSNDRLVACLRLRGHVEGPARLRLRRDDLPAAPPLMDRPLQPPVFNGPAFDGAERTLPVFFSVERWRQSWMCSVLAGPDQKKITAEILSPAGVVLATGPLGRILPQGRNDDPADFLRKLLPPLLILLLLAGVAANYLRTASLEMLDAALLILGTGLLVVAFIAYQESGLGGAYASFFAAYAPILISAGLILLALCFGSLYAKGFFDRQLTARGKHSLSAKVPLPERRRRRSQRTWLTVGIVLLLVVGVVILLWLYPRQFEECRYSLVDLPTNTAVPPINLPPTAAGP